MGLEVRIVLALDAEDGRVADVLRRVPQLVADAFGQNGLQIRTVSMTMQERDVEADDDY
jgi:hypothetical protein